MTVVEIVLIDYCNYVLSSYFKKAYYLKKKAFFCQTFYDTSLFWQSFSIFGRSMNNSMCFILSCFLHWLPEPYDYPSWCVILVFSVHATGAAIFISEWLSPQGLNRGATPLRGNGEVNQAVRRGSTHFFFFSLFYHFSDSGTQRHKVHTERTHLYSAVIKRSIYFYSIENKRNLIGFSSVFFFETRRDKRRSVLPLNDYCLGIFWHFVLIYIIRL